MRVLLAEDHHVLARTVAAGLRRVAIAVDVAASGDVAERLALLNDYDVVVLDRDLPVLSGDAVCRTLRALDEPPRIMMLTAATATSERVYGLEDLGADDYLAKPFDFAELVARIRTLSRRAPAPAPPALRSRGICLDLARREVQVAGQPVELTAKEFDVLRLLMEAHGEPVSHQELINEVWDRHLDPRTSTVRTTVSRLRAKLAGRAVVSADTGAGYRLC
ncbi:response regulator transcription factor [Streptomyces sp. NPDC057963]|uniref:response regulator transcription factor n=1 Tax=Streptomyces sp. NPDC057963 TaxID=3346290 RepID=UPI0036E9DA24